MKSRLYTLLAAVSLCVPTAFADSIVGSSGAGWQPYPTGPGQAYWNNPSPGAQDSSFANYLIGNGTFTGMQLDNWCCSSSLAMPFGPGNQPYWGLSGGQADSNFYFSNMLGTAFDAILYSSPTLGPSGSIGWYDVNDPTVLYPIVSGGLTPGTGGAFSATDDYGLWAQLSNGSYVFTQSSLNTGGLAGQQMFVVTTTSPGGDYGAFFIGVNDPSSGSNGFDDVVFQTSPFDPDDMPDSTDTQVPEPAGLPLVGAGACAVALMLLRARSAG